MNIPNILAALVLIVGVPLNVLVTMLLWRESHAHPRTRVLRERLFAEEAVLLLTIVFGIVFWNNDTLPPPLDTDVTKLVTRLVLLGVAVIPACYWLFLYRPRRP